MFAIDKNTHRKFPFNSLNNFFMGEMGLLPPTFDLFRQFILVPKKQHQSINVH